MQHESKLILVIPDGHVLDEQDLSRWAYLGNLIVDRKPDMIVQIGDFLTVASLSFWDKNNRLTMENMRFAKEMVAGRTALDLLFGPMNHYNEKMKDQKAKQYKPEVIWLHGNHEYRIDRYMDQHSAMKGQLDLYLPQNLNYAAYPIDLIVPYKEYVYREGIAFCHVPFNGRAPVTGIYIAKRALEVMGTSVVFGHAHRWQEQDFSRHGADSIQALCTGCFFEHNDEYTKGTQLTYRRTVALLHQYDVGLFDVEAISIERLKQEYK